MAENSPELMKDVSIQITAYPKCQVRRTKIRHLQQRKKSMKLPESEKNTNKQ